MQEFGFSLLTVAAVAFGFGLRRSRAEHHEHRPVIHSPAHLPSTQQLRRTDWLRIGTGAALLSAAAVVLSRLLAFAIWPELAAFEPLSSSPRSALFTTIPAFGSTAVFAWLDRRAARPARAFVLTSAAVLLVSIVPDYVLPFANLPFLRAQ